MARSRRPTDKGLEANRHFEFVIFRGVPETPQPMYEEDTRGTAEIRSTGLASEGDDSSRLMAGEVLAKVMLRDGRIQIEPASTETESRDDHNK